MNAASRLPDGVRLTCPELFCGRLPRRQADSAMDSTDGNALLTTTLTILSTK